MDDIYCEKILTRIIQGRLRINVGGLVLFIYEPDRAIIEESFDVYQEAYDKAYFGGVYVQEEIIQIMVENDLWYPSTDKKIKELSKQIENFKVEAFQSFFDSRKLFGIKSHIRSLEKKLNHLNYEKSQLDYATCEGVAKFTRQAWIISQTTKTEDGEKYDFYDRSLSQVLDIYKTNSINVEYFRKIARSWPFRGMWNASKKRADVFGRPSTELDSNQLALISYAQMYDNVFEHPESPNEKIVEDDDCLDGWFIVQQRKAEKERKTAEVNNMITNEKVANSQEIFLVAQTNEQVKEIYDLNSDRSRSIVRQRNQKVKDAGGERIRFTEFDDVKTEIHIQAVQNATEATKSRGVNRGKS